MSSENLVTLDVKDGIGIITVNNPPVNALSPGVPEGITACFEKAHADPAVKAMVLIGAGLGSLWRRRGFALWAPLAPIERRPPRMLRWLGTWPLTIYLLHQPLLMAALLSFRSVFRI